LTSLAQLGNPKAAGSNPVRGQFFAMLISCSRCSDGSMWLSLVTPLNPLKPVSTLNVEILNTLAT